MTLLANRLTERGFNPSSVVISGFELGRRLELASGLPGQDIGLRAEGYGPRPGRTVGTLRAQGARLTDGSAETDPKARLPMAILVGLPTDAGLAGRAGHRLRLPIDVKLVRRQALAGAGLPTGIHGDRPNELNPILGLTVDQLSGVDITLINDVLAR